MYILHFVKDIYIVNDFSFAMVGKRFGFTCEVLFNGSIAVAEIYTRIQVVMNLLIFP